MLFFPKIDLNEYCDSEGNYTEYGSKKLIEYSDMFYRKYDERKDRERKDHTEICRAVNSFLGSDDKSKLLEINDIIASEKYQRLCGAFFDLEVFRSSYAIYYTEKCMGISRTIYDIVDSIDEYLDLRMQMLYCFRRIQMWYQDTDTERKFLGILNKDISLFYLVQMLTDIKVGDKYSVGMKLATLYGLSGRQNEAEALRSHIKKNYGTVCPDDNIDFNEFKNIINSGGEKSKTNPDKEICFVTCVNNDQIYDECIYYINKLVVPQGYGIKTVKVTGAGSMASGYNSAIRENNADIIVYLHQDVCILNPFFLLEIIRIFEKDPEIGMIGMIGSRVLSPDGIMWNGKRVGNLYSVRPDRLNYAAPTEKSGSDYEIVEAVDGFLMVSNRKIKWRDDIFDGWDFYDISQCAEYKKRGLKIVVPEQNSPWTSHDDGIINIYDYDKYRRIYLREYKIT